MQRHSCGIRNQVTFSAYTPLSAVNCHCWYIALIQSSAQTTSNASARAFPSLFIVLHTTLKPLDCGQSTGNGVDVAARHSKDPAMDVSTARGAEGELHDMHAADMCLCVLLEMPLTHAMMKWTCCAHHAYRACAILH